ncbi:MAG TPA: GntR family transcriptional regulator [Bryobacteraceae bacterium]|nr:GntR family transcriptional regulator [Bryobacteraceae bacterium]
MQTAAPIRRTSLKDHVVEYIRDAILSGRLEPGDRIVELKLARELQIGTTAVREALFELEALGFVTRVINKGTFITKLTPEDVDQIFRVRHELEGLAAQLVFERIETADLSELEKYASDMSTAAEQANPSEFYRADLEFHRALWSLSGNRHLAKALDQIVVPLFTFFIMKTSRESKADLLKGVERHFELIQCLKRRENPRDRFAEAIVFFSQQERQILFNQPSGSGSSAAS